jgi:hypothetical protein
MMVHTQLRFVLGVNIRQVYLYVPLWMMYSIRIFPNSAICLKQSYMKLVSGLIPDAEHIHISKEENLDNAKSTLDIEKGAYFE